jgi:hypothetical protein
MVQVSNLSFFKILEILWYFMHPRFFTNLTFIVSMILVYLKQIGALPYILTLNLFILVIGSIIAIFFVRSAINVAMKRLNVSGVSIPKFSGIHFFMIFVGIMIHVVMTIVLKWYIYKKFTHEEIERAETYADKHRMHLAITCIGIVLLYFMTGLYTVYGMNNIGILSLFIIGPPIMYLCTYLDDYYFYSPNHKNLN